MNMKKKELSDSERKGVATAAGVAVGAVAGGGAAYAASSGRVATDAAPDNIPEKTVEAEYRPHTSVYDEPAQTHAASNQHSGGTVQAEVEAPVDPPADNTPTVEVLSYETVEYDGTQMDTAVVEIDGTTHRYVDYDRDGYADFEGVDENHDMQISENEVHNLNPGEVSMQGFKEAYNTPGGGAHDEFLALQDEGPDYIDDGSFDPSGADMMA